MFLPSPPSVCLSVCLSAGLLESFDEIFGPERRFPKSYSVLVVISSLRVQKSLRLS